LGDAHAITWLESTRSVGDCHDRFVGWRLGISAFWALALLAVFLLGDGALVLAPSPSFF